MPTKCGDDGGVMASVIGVDKCETQRAIRFDGPHLGYHMNRTMIYYVMGIMEDGTLCEYLLKHHGFLKGFELCKLE
jgi:hypothetical protein